MASPGDGDRGPASVARTSTRAAAPDVASYFFAVGQAMFFADGERVYVVNDGSAELNPGTAVSGARQELTASL